MSAALACCRTAALVLVLAAAPAALGQSTPPAKTVDADAAKLEDTPKLTVRGEAELRKPADQVRLAIGVVNEAPEAASALAENSDAMRNVVKAITKAGLAEDEYETGRFRIRPIYSRRPRQAEPDWQPQITGYEVANSITIRTKKLDLVGALISVSNKAGANTVEVTGFDLADPRTYRAEAIRAATRHAVEDARTLADAASLRLVRIIAVNLDHEPVRTSEMRFAPPTARALADSGAAPPIEPGDVEIRATVTIMYEIAPAE